MADSSNREIAISTAVGAYATALLTNDSKLKAYALRHLERVAGDYANFVPDTRPTFDEAFGEKNQPSVGEQMRAAGDALRSGRK